MISQDVELSYTNAAKGVDTLRIIKNTWANSNNQLLMLRPGNNAG